MKDWPSGNSYLRLLSTSLREPRTSMTIHTLSEPERLLVLDTIQLYVKRMNSIGVRITTTMTSGRGGTTKFSLSVSKEMSS